jgi:23S rRNA (pseudouridine1915-N3)-methyltransferase
MRVVLLAVGRLRPAYREACDDYLRRLRRHLAVEERELREGRDADDRLLAALPDGAAVTLLDRDGAGWSSEELATRVQRWQQAARDRVLLIGGADGTGDAVRRRADERWSLGPLTLPHELARVIVTEQLYRAATILAGHPYHRRSPPRPGAGSP